jgi:hypothetical protein
MTADEMAEMAREDRDEWAALVAALDAQSGSLLHDTASPAWTSRDVYAHLARWIEETTAALSEQLAGRTRPPIPGTDDEINARWQLEDSRLRLADARTWAHQAFERRLATIEAVPRDRWDESLKRIARGDGAAHYRAHRIAIVPSA